MEPQRWLSSFQPRGNVTAAVAAKVGRDLHRQPLHPLNIIKQRIEAHFAGPASGLSGSPSFSVYDDLDPVVPTAANFDSLLIPPEHVSRRLSDTYYLDDETVLRTHTSAHQTTLLRAEAAAADAASGGGGGGAGFGFLVSGDVYRRDEVDRSHYPVFHQMEGVRVFSHAEAPPELRAAELSALAEADLRNGLEAMARALFGDVEMRWVDAYFPFTAPSAELEIFFGGAWLEVLGCGVIHEGVLRNAGLAGRTGWAFGLGLERLAMVLFSIPDIRLFWSEDERFLKQFQSGEIVRFQPYSRQPPCLKDISFWIEAAAGGSSGRNDDESHGSFHDNDLFELVRDVAGDLAEQVELIDTFEHAPTQRVSKCFRITYRSMDRNLTNAEVDELQAIVRERVAKELRVALR